MVGFMKKRMGSGNTTAHSDGIAMGKGHKSAIGLSSIAALLAFIGWGTAVVALATLQHNCSAGSILGGTTTRIVGSGSLDLFQPTANCGHLYAFTWWALALELLALILCIAGMWMPHFRKHRPGCVAILAVSTVISMIYTNTFLALRRIDVGGESRRATVAFAGFLVYTAANLLLILALGRYENDHDTGVARVYDARTNDYDRTDRREVTGLDNTGPAINPVRGYAGPSPNNGTPVLHTDRNIV
jgi:hypothetical protein